MSYNNKVFGGRTNSAGDEVEAETLHFSCQDEDRLTGTYSGVAIVDGHLIGKVLPEGRLESVPPCEPHGRVDGRIVQLYSL